MNYHTKSIDETFKLLDTSSKGLTTKEALKREEHFGKNLLPKERETTLFIIFFEQFKSPIIYILLIASIVSLMIKEYSDAGFIMAVLFINAIIGTYQEYTARKKANALKSSVKTYVDILRDKVKKRVISTEVTIGDILLFESGSEVPADVRLIEANELFVDESLLTGESINILKNYSFISDDINLPIGDRLNMLYAGSFVTKGRGRGVVTNIGSNTQIGKIAALLASAKEKKAPLIIRMEKFSLNIARIIGVVIILLIFLGIYENIAIKELFFFAVALAVSSIPEGLPVAITVALSNASMSMSKKNVIVRKLSAIEGLGSCTLIASDKTGTLTQNRLKVEYFVTLENEFKNPKVLDSIILSGFVLCNEATYQKKEQEYEYLGDQVDVALAKYAIEADEKYANLKNSSNKVYEIPYESQNAYSAIFYETNFGNMHYIKGSIETIVNFCCLKKEEKEAILELNNQWAQKGFRNIALAYKISEKRTISLDNYIFLGFAAIIDPLREDAKIAVQSAQKAGIEVAMVTGDHPNTAFHIAQKLNIAIEKDEVIGGSQIQEWINRGEKEEEIASKRVFARVSPEHKQKIVTAFQRLGHFVAVTGDGVNDAPALKYSNIGISMGKSGTDVARESSDLILTDDSFSSIVNGIKEGRVAYDNIRKVIHLLISTGFAEIVLIVLSMLFFLPIPLLPVQLLWLNLVTNGIQDVTLGFEKAEKGVLERNPRDPKEPIFNKIMISRILSGGLYMGITAFALFYFLLKTGYTEESARNLTLLLMVLFENVHVFNSRSENLSIFKINHKKNLFLLLSVVIAQAVHILCLYTPFMQSLLGVEPVSFIMWFYLLVIAFVLIIVMESEKVIFSSLRR